MDRWEKWLTLFVMVLLTVMLCVASYDMDELSLQNEDLSKRCFDLELRADELEFRSFRVDELMGMVYWLRDGMAKVFAYQGLHNDGTSAHIGNLWVGLSENALLLGWCCEDKLLENWEDSKVPVEVEKQPEEDKNDPTSSAYRH